MVEKHDKAPILALHSSGLNYLEKYILDGLDYVTYAPQGFRGFRLWDILKSSLVCCFRDFRLLVKYITSTAGMKGVKAVVYGRLVAQEIRKYQPKVVLTFIDNSGSFHMACRIVSEIPFLAIQNGARTTRCAGKTIPVRYRWDEYFCFGPAEKELFDRFGHDIKKFTPCGSLLGGVFLTTCLPDMDKPEQPYDIAIISQWHPEEREDLPDEYKAIDLMVEFVARYAVARGVKVHVVLRPKLAFQKEYYDGYFKGGCVFQENELGDFTSYGAVWNSRLAITMNSTLGLESFGAGNKVLFMNPYRKDWLQPTIEGLWSFRESDYQAFEERMDILLSMSRDDYLAQARDEMKRVMAYDPERPAHAVIRQRLLELAGS